MKKYHCCIPGCNTYGPLSNFISIPFESQWRDQWLAVIPRKDWVVDSTTVACINHFQVPSVIPFVSPNNNKNEKNAAIYCNIKAVPHIIPISDSLNNNRQDYFPTDMFELYCRDCEGPDTFGDIEDDDKDYVVNYWYFKLMYPQRFATFLENVWKSVSTVDYTVFYTIDFSEIPRITNAIKVDNTLCVTVTLDGRSVDPCDLTWVLPITTCKVNRWSQLQIMLTMFGK